MLRRGRIAGVLAVGGLVVAAGLAAAGADSPAERGRKALLERNHIPPIWSRDAYDNAWKAWGVAEKPANYAEAFRDRYGLHPPPYPNGTLPMGLREGMILFRRGLSVDCLACHGGSILGQSYVGLGNTALDVHALFEELNRADGRSGQLPFQFANVRGTSEAGGFSVFLLGLRHPDLSLRRPPLALGLHDDMCEDVPAWWHLKKKKTMYHTGSTDARSVRSLMQFMMGSLTTPAHFEQAEPAFRDIRAFLLSLEPPKYPFPVDAAKAARGGMVFKHHCARCHGTYGETWTYPNKIVPVDEIGTDRRRFAGITETFGRYYNQSWFAKEDRGWFGDGFAIRDSDGYQAPPLDGIWSTAPYLHNGSVPTLFNLLKSDTRPAIFTRSYRTDREAYDPQKVGWKVQVLDRGADKTLPPIEQRKVYDTNQPGRGNGGHTYGDKLTDDERTAVIEYLKTL